MSFSHLLALILINLLSVSAQCLGGYVFNIVSQSCLPCSSNCKDCYNVNQNQCTSCPLNYLISQSNTSTCVQSCQIGEIQGSNQTCIKSLVQGCIKYDSNQTCLECNSNLEMDLNQKCHLKQNVCPSQYDFIQQPYSQDQCLKSCKTSYYQNQSNQICEKVIQCIQFDQSPSQFKYIVQQIDNFYDDQYLIRAGQCYFAVVNQNFEIIYERNLYQIQSNEQQYQSDGEDSSYQSFSIGKYGGCIANSTLIVIDFMKNLLVYQINDLQNSYEVLQIDILNQIVFFKTQFNEIAWYDAIKNQFSTYQFSDQQSVQGMFQINLVSSVNYYFQIGYTTYYIAILQEQEGRQLLFLENPLIMPYHLQIIQLYQKEQEIIAVLINYSLRVNSVSKLIFANQTEFKEEQLNTTPFYQFIIQYNPLINSIIQQDLSNQNFQILVLDSSLDQIKFSFNSTYQNLYSFQIYENQLTNSTFVFFITEKIQFLNLTDFVFKYESGQANQTEPFIQDINFTFNPNQLTLKNVIFKKNNIIEIFLSQVLQVQSFNYKLIRIQYNLTDQTFIIKYINPYESLKLYHIDQTSQDFQQHQNIFSTKNTFDINSFYVYEISQVFSQQIIGVQKVKYPLQNLQKNQKTNTRFFNLELNDDTILFDEIQLINNRYFLLRKYLNENTTEYIVDIATKKQILQYTYFIIPQTSSFYYIEKRNILVAQPVPQIFSLDTGQILIQNLEEYFFSLDNFIVINDDQIAYIAYNDSYELIIYLIDLQLLSVNEVYNFGQQFYVQFYLVDNFCKPMMAFNDIIYLLISYTNCQPFSLSQKQLVYQITSLQADVTIYPSTNYQKSGEIFIFADILIYIYTFDLSEYLTLNLGVFYPYLVEDYLPIIQNDRYVFYYDQKYFYKFDMELKQFQQMHAKSDVDLYKNLQVNIFAFDKFSQYVKKSESIIDTQNMIIIKSQLDTMSYIGNIILDDNTQIDCFYSQNGVFWFQNLFNQPFNIFNLTQDFIIQDIQLQQNRIALYDNAQKQLIIYNSLKTIQDVIKVELDVQFNLKITITDWDAISFVWIQNEKIYLQSLQKNPQIQLLSQLESNISEYQYCPFQKVIIAKSIQQMLYTIQLENQIKINIQTYNETEVLFLVNCEENIIIQYYPFVQIFDLITGNLTDPFDQYYNILIGITSSLSQINIINIPGKNELFIYETTNQYSKDAVYYYQNQTTLIIVDYTPNIYLCNYLSQDISIFNIKTEQIQGVLMDENKNVVFLYSQYFIYAYKFPIMQFMETISLQKYNDAPILQIYLNTQLSLMIVQTNAHIISFDLTEIVYASETNLLQYQKIQNLYLGQQLSVSYSIVNLSLNLFQNALIVDTLLFETTQNNIYPYIQQLVFMRDNTFLFFQLKKLYVVKVDLEQLKQEISKEINLFGLPDNYFYDNVRNQVFMLYQQNLQLSQINLNEVNPTETALINFSEGDSALTFILSDFIVFPSNNIIQIYNYIYNLTSQLTFPSNSQIKFAFKLQFKDFENYTMNWWNIPFDYEERYNNNDIYEQDSKLICIIIQQTTNLNIQIVNVETKQIINSYLVYNSQITNIVGDPFRKLIYMVNNQGNTLVFSYSLKLITNIQNACLKQAIISYDSDFVYSICPNDIIIYNGLSFQQQFAQISQGIQEVQNLINTRYNNHFIIIQKNKFSVIQIDFLNNHKLIYEVNQSYQKLLNFQIIQDQSLQNYLDLLLCSYESTQHLTIPLQQNQTCFISIQQQNRPLENIYTNITLIQSLQNLQNSNQMLTVIEIEYQEGQCLTSINFDQINQQNLDQNHQISLVSYSNSQLVNVCWSNETIYSSLIKDFNLKSMALIIQNSVSVNQNTQMKNFQMYNVTLEVQESLILSDYDKNVQLVVIENIQIIGNQTLNCIFTLNNNNRVIISQINVFKANKYQLFSMQNNNEIVVSNLTINQSNEIKAFSISLTNALNISDILVQSVNLSSIFDIQGTIISQFQNINLLFSDSQANRTEIYGTIINQLQTSTNCFYIISEQLVIDNFNISDSKFFEQNTENTYENQNSLITILKYNKSTIQNLNSINNQIQILSIDQQDNIGDTVIMSCQFFNSKIENQLFEFQNINSLLLDSIKVKNISVYNNAYSSIILLNQCNQVLVTNSVFENNTNTQGFGGSIYSIDNSIIQINNTKFYQNKCLQQSGGAISIYNSVKAGNVIITKSEFMNNQAYNSTGGAINLQNSNMILQDSILSANKALIGGAIYYEQIIPDFILESQKGKNNNNIISQNFAKFYGKNFGSTLRSIKIDIDDMKVLQNHATIQSQNGKIEISQFKSGDIVNFKNIQMMDEENNPIIIPAYNQSQYIQYSYQVQEIIESLGVSFQWDQTNQLIQLVGELQSKQFYDRGFKLNAQIIFKPQSNMVLQIVSNNFPKLQDSKGNTYLQQGQLFLNITIYLDKCLLGQITKQQSNSTICEDCPEGKYSLNINDSDYCLEGHKGPLCYSCDTYGQLWGKQYSEIFSSGKCYDCEDNLSLVILENILLFISIFYYIFVILKNIIRKLQAKLAGYFINKANLLFLGSTLRQSDRPQIVSKILTDHLQILSLISTLSFKIPSYFNIPIQMSGNSLSITSKSIDCVLSKTSIFSPKSTERAQTNRFVLFSQQESPTQFKKQNSFKNMRDKWDYYTRKTKDSPLSTNRYIPQEKTQDYIKETSIMETGTLQTSNYEQGKQQLSSDFDLNKKYQEILNLDS
ncbi:hypothetical protein ABPG73_022780 [Tetrahymena malaccensis]